MWIKGISHIISVHTLSLKAHIAWHWCNHVVCSCVLLRSSRIHALSLFFFVQHISNNQSFVRAQVCDYSGQHIISQPNDVDSGFLSISKDYFNFSYLHNSVVSGDSRISYCQAVLSGVERVQTDAGRCLDCTTIFKIRNTKLLKWAKPDLKKKKEKKVDE